MKSDLPPRLRPPEGLHPCQRCDLRGNPAFQCVGPEQLLAIENMRLRPKLLKAGEQLIREGERCHHLYTLYAGWAFRYKSLSDGRRQILNFLLPGDFIGLQQEFADGAMHGVEAATDVSVCVFARDGLWSLFQQQPQMGYDITWLAAREEQLVDDNLVSAGRRNASERVAMLLIHLYRRAARVGLAREGRVEFPFNQQHLADALGLSLVHTNKTLRRLQRMGLYQLDGGWLSIPQPHGLESLGDYFERPMRPVPLI